MQASKVDHLRTMHHLYEADDRPSLVEVPPMRFLMADGHGDPNHAATFREAVEAVFALSYAIKHRVRSQGAIDYRVMPLEGLWWIPDARVWDFADKSDWDWTLMIMQPEAVCAEVFEPVRQALARRRRLPALDRVHLGSFDEGLSAQILHLGPWADERPTLERLYAFVREQGFLPTGKHHEIYLSDPMRTSPERLRTIVRQPVSPRS